MNGFKYWLKNNNVPFLLTTCILIFFVVSLDKE